MKRRTLLISIALFAVAAGSCLLFFCVTGTAAPQLRLLGFTNSTSGAGKLAALQFYNSTGHTVYLLGLTNDSPFFSRESKVPWGWQAADKPSRPSMTYSWGVNPGQSCTFNVPVMTNKPEGWRVTLRYFDGEEVVAWSWSPAIKLPWKGSGRNLNVSTDTLTQQQ